MLERATTKNNNDNKKNRSQNCDDTHTNTQM